MKKYRLDNKINFLKSYGYDDRTINIILKNKYSFLDLSENNIKHKIELLESFGFTKEDIIYITTNQNYFLRSSNERIINTLKLYDDIGLINCIKKNPKVLIINAKLIYARYQYLASIGIVINEDSNYKLFLSNNIFENQFGITKEKLLSEYDFEKYISGEEKLIEVENPQYKVYLKDIAKEYSETKDEKLREQLIYTYMPICESIVSKYANENNKDDLLQIAYERLIKTIDSYIYNDKVHICTYVFKNVNDKMVSVLSKKRQVESINGLEIYSNSSLEDKIIEKSYVDYLINMIKDYMEQFSSYKFYHIFKQLYGIDCEEKTIDQICKENNCTKQFVHECEARALSRIYLYMKDKVKYLPSDKLYSLFKSCRLYGLIPKEMYREIDNIDYSELDYLDLFEDCDELENSHSILVRKQK